VQFGANFLWAFGAMTYGPHFFEGFPDLTVMTISIFSRVHFWNGALLVWQGSEFYVDDKVWQGSQSFQEVSVGMDGSCYGKVLVGSSPLEWITNGMTRLWL